jgi:hypothetical protein
MVETPKKWDVFFTVFNWCQTSISMVDQLLFHVKYPIKHHVFFPGEIPNLWGIELWLLSGHQTWLPGKSPI